MLVERALQRHQIGDVAGNKGHVRQLIFGHNQLEPAWVAGEIEHHRLGTFAHQVAHHPRADAAQRAGNKKTFGWHGHFSYQDTSQSSIFRPTTRPNSRVLWVTSVRSLASAVAAIRRSCGLIGVPFFARSARTLAAISAARSSSGNDIK